MLEVPASENEKPISIPLYETVSLNLPHRDYLYDAPFDLSFLLFGGTYKDPKKSFEDRCTLILMSAPNEYSNITPDR